MLRRSRAFLLARSRGQALEERRAARREPHMTSPTRAPSRRTSLITQRFGWIDPPSLARWIERRQKADEHRRHHNNDEVQRLNAKWQISNLIHVARQFDQLTPVRNCTDDEPENRS